MRIIETKVYLFEELDKQIQEKVIQDNYDININYDWWEFIYDEFNWQDITIKHFDIYRREIGIEIRVTYENTANLIKNYGFNTDSDIYKDAIYFLEQRKELFNKYGENDKIKEEFYDEYDEEIEVIEKEYHKNLEEEILRQLSNDYDYYTSEEAIRETLIVNEYEFTEQGKRI